MKMLKRSLKIVLCLLIFFIVLMRAERILSLKHGESMDSLLYLYAQPKDSIDFLIMGSSHAGVNIDLTYAWEQYGISIFNLWGPAQTFDITYYWLKEALKTQHPKGIGLEIFAAVLDKDGTQLSPKNKLDIERIEDLGLRIQAFNAVPLQEDKVNHILGLPIFHTRYSELSVRDFRNLPQNPEMRDQKGQSNFAGTFEISDWGNSEGITEIRQLADREEKALRNIIELCRQEKIPLFLFKTPAARRDQFQPIYNRIAQIAEENGIPFINYNLMDEQTGIVLSDYSEDGHLNFHGSRKIGRHLADYIVDNYELEDHRGDPRYASWDAFVEDTRNEWLQKEWELPEWFTLARNSGGAILLAKNGKSKNAELDDMISEFLGFSVEEIKEKEYAVWVSENPADEPFIDCYAGGLALEAFIRGEKFFFDFTDGLKLVHKDQMVTEKSQADWLAVVYDRENKIILDVLTINAETGEFQHISTEKELQDY